MSQALFSTAYFPPISYFIALKLFENCQLENHENYQKQSYRNRCIIAGPNGNQNLTIPVIKIEGNNTPITLMQLQQPMSWRKQHWQSLITAYNSSPYFMYYADSIESLLFGSYENLWQMNTTILEGLLDILKIKKPIFFTETFEAQPKNCIDFRNIIHPKKSNPFSIIIEQNPYNQVFNDRFTFASDLSILDLIFNLGPESSDYLRRMGLVYMQSE